MSTPSNLSPMRCRWPIAACLATALLLAGCGGGSDPLSNSGGAVTTPAVITTQPAPPAPTPDKREPAPAFGINLGIWGFLHPGAAEQASIAARTRLAGGTVLRIPVPWYSVQPYPPIAGAPPTFTFKAYDAIRAAMKRDGVRPLILILGTPSWALPQPWHCPTAANCDGAPAPAHMKDLGLYVRELIKAFPDAVAIEPYNEVNTANNFGPAPVDVRKYARVLATVHSAVRAANSSIPVITAGLVNYKQGFPGDMDAPVFLDALYKAGTKGSFEGIGLHPYAATDDPSDKSAPWLSRIDAAREVARRNGDAGRPIWITESGYPTGGKAAWTVVVSEAEQSRLERCEYQLLVGSRDIKVVLHNYLFDTKKPGEGDSLEDHWGLFRTDGSQKPIVAAMSDMLRSPRRVTDCSEVH